MVFQEKCICLKILILGVNRLLDYMSFNRETLLGSDS